MAKASVVRLTKAQRAEAAQMEAGKQARVAAKLREERERYGAEYGRASEPDRMRWLEGESGKWKATELGIVSQVRAGSFHGFVVRHGIAIPTAPPPPAIDDEEHRIDTAGPVARTTNDEGHERDTSGTTGSTNHDVVQNSNTAGQRFLLEFSGADHLLKLEWQRGLTPDQRTTLAAVEEQVARGSFDAYVKQQISDRRSRDADNALHPSTRAVVHGPEPPPVIQHVAAELPVLGMVPGIASVSPLALEHVTSELGLPSRAVSPAPSTETYDTAPCSLAASRGSSPTPETCVSPTGGAPSVPVMPSKSWADQCEHLPVTGVFVPTPRDLGSLHSTGSSSPWGTIGRRSRRVQGQQRWRRTSDTQPRPNVWSSFNKRSAGHHDRVHRVESSLSWRSTKFPRSELRNPHQPVPSSSEQQPRSRPDRPTILPLTPAAAVSDLVALFGREVENLPALHRSVLAHVHAMVFPYGRRDGRTLKPHPVFGRWLRFWFGLSGGISVAGEHGSGFGRGSRGGMREDAHGFSGGACRGGVGQGGVRGPSPGSCSLRRHS